MPQGTAFLRIASCMALCVQRTWAGVELISHVTVETTQNSTVRCVYTGLRFRLGIVHWFALNAGWIFWRRNMIQCSSFLIWKWNMLACCPFHRREIWCLRTNSALSFVLRQCTILFGSAQSNEMPWFNLDPLFYNIQKRHVPSCRCTCLSRLGRTRALLDICTAL
jgi:hypothetical protein